MTRFSRLISIAALTGGIALLHSPAALAETLLKVTLWDKGATAMDMVGQHAPLGMAVEGADPAMATMGITLDATEVPAGEVKFSIVNDSGEFYHALMVIPVTDPTTPLPYLDADQRVDEGAVEIAANLGELKPKSSASKTATLAPGTYILICNISGHYSMGMWTLLTVTE